MVYKARGPSINKPDPKCPEKVLFHHPPPTSVTQPAVSNLSKTTVLNTFVHNVQSTLPYHQKNRLDVKNVDTEFYIRLELREWFSLRLVRAAGLFSLTFLQIEVLSWQQRRRIPSGESRKFHTFLTRVRASIGDNKRQGGKEE